MLYALKCKDGDGDSTGFVEQMIQLWDDDFKFTDEELLDYIYAFPLYLKKLRQKSHSKIQKEQKPTKHKPTHEHEHAINVTEVQGQDANNSTVGETKAEIEVPNNSTIVVNELDDGDASDSNVNATNSTNDNLNGG